MLNIFKAALLVCIATLVGCASTPSPEKMQAAVSGYELPAKAPSDMGMVYIVRPDTVGALIRFNVFLDDKEAESEMGYTRGDQYIYFFADEGHHTISSKAENWADIDVDIKAGEVTYIRQHPEMGIIMARNSLSQLSKLEGKYFVKETGQGTIIKTKK